MKTLTLHAINLIDELASPKAASSIGLDSKAETIFTDFNLHKPFTLDADVSAIEAERMMQKSHVRLKFVIDKNAHFRGIVSLSDLNNQEILKRIANGEKREEISVEDFMIPRDKLFALDYSDLEHATIADIVEALQHSHQQHCLVVDEHKIRGIFSASDITRKLGLAINIANNSNFVNVFEAIRQRNH
jgi:CBS domain containing-hemolysin-like protein